MAYLRISVQETDFDLNQETQHLLKKTQFVGAMASFIGFVRARNDGDEVIGLRLEHYPGMTEQAIEAIAEEAILRWELGGVTIIHRVGALSLNDQIVLVLVASEHRHKAFEACEYIMDYLKSEAPLWKEETTGKGKRWLQAKQSDFDAQQRWRK